MIAALLLTSLGTIDFMPVDLPGLEVGPPNPYNGQRTTNMRTVDVDRDGELDLLLPTRCYFQRDGAFPLSDSVFLPAYREQPRADVHGSELYLQFADRLQSYRWEDGRWVGVINHEVSWPTDVYEEPPPAEALAPPAVGLRFTEFLEDIDGDGVPEIVAINLEGLHIFRRSGDVVFRANVLDVLPPYRIDTPHYSAPTQNVAPARTPLPVRRLAGRLMIAGDHVDVLTERDAHSNHPYGYVLRRHYIATTGEFSLLPDRSETIVYPSVPNSMRPCRLNADDTIDFAGIDWRFSDASATPVPLLTVSTTLDGGASVNAIRVHGIQPQCPFVDVDNDGKVDVVATLIPTTGRGIHSAIVKRLFQRSLQFDVRVYRQAGGRISTRPWIDAPVRIGLTAAPHKDGPQARRYREGRAVDLTGDYDGDGLNDMLVHEEIDTVNLYRNTGDGFDDDPMATFEVGLRDDYAPFDVDGDGRTDVVVSRIEPDSIPISHVLFSRPASR